MQYEKKVKRQVGIAGVLARDADFDKKIRQLRPDWFAKAKKVA